MASPVRRTHVIAGGVAAALALAAWPAAAAAPGPRPEAQAAQDQKPDNPCLGPDARKLLCPRLSIDKPRDMYFQRQGKSTVLRATSSLNSVGKGPIEIHGHRRGPNSMVGVQKIYKRGGGKISIRTGAHLGFKSIPGQYRYWKLLNAARFELWSLDSDDHPVKRVRRGPKLYYCLRDLRHTRSLPRSPGTFHYPGCSQNLHARHVTIGTSVGWSDIYPSTYHQQWINVTGLHGRYLYRLIADPTDVIYTSNQGPVQASRIVSIP
jgi:hypothetical protein